MVCHAAVLHSRKESSSSMTKHHTVVRTDLTIDASSLDSSPIPLETIPTDPAPTPTQTILDGTANADTIKQAGGSFYIDAGAGDDRINVGNGSDTILGGDGNDRITAGNGNDFIDAGAGNNIITVGTGHDTIVAGDGNNTLLIGDWVNGSGIQDIFLGNGDNRVTDYGNGDVHLQLGSGNNSVSLGGGNDTVIASGVGNDYIQGGDGNDLIQGSDGNDQELEGQGGNDTIYGMGGGDRIVYTASASFDQVGDGMDKIDGGAGNDLLEVYGSAHGDNFTLAAIGNGHALLNQDDGNVNNADLVNVEHIDFTTAGEDGVNSSGSDNISVFDMTGTGVKLVTIDLAGTNPNAGDGNIDTITLDGAGSGEAVTVVLDAKGELVITGLAEKVVISHFDANDVVNIEGIANVTNLTNGHGPIINSIGPAIAAPHMDAMMAAQAEALNQHAHA